VYLLTYPSLAKEKLIGFWQKTIPTIQVDTLRILFYSGMIFFTYEWYSYLIALSKAAIFYKPLLVLQLFQLHFPSPEVILILYILLLSSCIGAILNIKPLFTSALATFLFIWMQGLLYSFEKLDHTFATFTYAAMLMPFLIYERRKAFAQRNIQQEAWPLQLICVCIALVYLLSGLEKLFISGLQWMSADNFRSYIFMHQAPAGLAIAQSSFLCIILPILAIIFQLCFFTIFFFPKLKTLILIIGAGFHAGTFILLNIGWYLNAWIFVYIFFIDWHKMFEKLNSTHFSILFKDSSYR
jgi:hypothetical protein